MEATIRYRYITRCAQCFQPIAGSQIILFNTNQALRDKSLTRNWTYELFRDNFQKNNFLVCFSSASIMLAKITCVLVLFFFVGALAGPSPTAVDNELLSLHNQARGGGLWYDKRLFAVRLYLCIRISMNV